MTVTPRLDTLLRDAAEVHADQLAVVDGELRLTHAELARRSSTLAEALIAGGVGPGAVVSFHLPNGAGAIEVYRACWEAGGIAAPIHPAASAVEAEALRARLRPTVHLAGPDDVEALRRGHSPPAAGPTPRLLDPDVAVLLATSGSTGTPKLVAHTHRSLTHKATQMPGVHGLDASDVVLMPAPLAHMSGLLNGVLLPGVAGMACVTMARWRPVVALELIELEGVTFMVGPPTFFVALMDEPSFDQARVASLRLISCGGAGVTPAFVHHATERIGATVKRTYGSTEAPTIATAVAGDDAELAASGDGRPLPGVELRLVEGELCVRGPELMAGYLRDDGTIDPATDAEGFFHTGDLARIDDGWLTITGRLKDLIIRGGENIGAAEVEQVLEAHPTVRQAAVVGLPDDRLGEIVAAFVEADADFDLEACRAWFLAQGVARLKTPEHLEVLDALPVLASGKVDKATLRTRSRSRT